ncbi:MAG: transposase [Planctomycetota bacterium]|nr:transposase [Planctomycetota bacterium]
MSEKRRTHTPEFKAMVALEAIKGKFTTDELAKKHQVNPSLIHAWKKTVVLAAPVAMSGDLHEDPKHREVKEKEREIDRLVVENEWLQRALQRMTVSERKAAVESDNPNLPLIRQVKLLNINRSSIYYARKIPSIKAKEQRIAT